MYIVFEKVLRIVFRLMSALIAFQLACGRRETVVLVEGTSWIFDTLHGLGIAGVGVSAEEEWYMNGRRWVWEAGGGGG